MYKISAIYFISLTHDRLFNSKKKIVKILSSKNLKILIQHPDYNLLRFNNYKIKAQYKDDLLKKKLMLYDLLIVKKIKIESYSLK